MPYKNKEDLYRYQIQRWIQRKLDAITYLGGKCERCNGEFHYSVYEFHHKDPKTKDLDWNKLRLRAWEAIKAELNKCALLCANCHRLTHAEWKAGAP